MEERRLEHGFIADQEHPIVAGLDERDLSNWRGRAETVPSEKRPSEAFRHNQAAALETPHLTNRNLVAGYVLANPSYGSILPVVTGGFDRSDALVLDARSGKGRILFCQADVTSRISSARSWSRPLRSSPASDTAGMTRAKRF